MKSLGHIPQVLIALAAMMSVLLMPFGTARADTDPQSSPPLPSTTLSTASPTSLSVGAWGIVNGTPTPSTPTLGDETTTAPVAEDGGDVSWFSVALVVVAGAAVLTIAGLVVRAVYGRADAEVPYRAGSLDLLLDPAPEDRV